MLNLADVAIILIIVSLGIVCVVMVITGNCGC